MSASRKPERVPIVYHQKTNNEIEFDTEEFTMESPAKVKFEDLSKHKSQFPKANAEYHHQMDFVKKASLYKINQYRKLDSKR